MAKAATFKRYNGSAWEELTFTPSSHTHDMYEIDGIVTSLEDKVSVTEFGDAYTNFDNWVNDLNSRVLTLESNSGGSDASSWVKKTGTITVDSSVPMYVKIESMPSSGVQIASGSDLSVYLIPSEEDDTILVCDEDLLEGMFSRLSLVEGETDVYTFNFIRALNGQVITATTTNTAYRQV